VSFILAIDQGTTNTKALLVDSDGAIIHRASAPLRLIHPQPDFVEQDPLQIWQSVLDAAGKCIARSQDIAGIAISNQRETILAWERSTGNPIANAIIWQCRRAAPICDRLRANGHEQLLRNRTGLGIDPLFSAAKLTWLLENTPGLRERAATGEICFGTVDSWLVFKLTEGRIHACDLSNASRTQLLNLDTQQWDTELLSIFGVPCAALPQLKPSSNIFGECSAIPPLRGVPIVSTIGDSHAALAAHGSYTPGTIKATYGTGSSLMTLTPTLDTATSAKLARTIAWSVQGNTQYALEGNISMAGSAIQWLGEFLRLPNPVHDVAALAASVPNAAGVHFVPAMLGLGAPHWDTSARGIISGLGSTSTTAHLARAAIESIAFQVRDVFGAMEEEAEIHLPSLHADGGATGNDTLMQFQADMLGRPVLRSRVEDLSAVGAAWLGGMTLGWWPSLSALEKIPQQADTFSPQLSASERDTRYTAWRLAIARARLQQEAE
jgi:glycerol kinase